VWQSFLVGRWWSGVLSWYCKQDRCSGDVLKRMTNVFKSPKPLMIWGGVEGVLNDGGKCIAVVNGGNDRESFSVDFYCRGRICSV